MDFPVRVYEAVYMTNSLSMNSSSLKYLPRNVLSTPSLSALSPERSRRLASACSLAGGAFAPIHFS